MPDYSFNDLDKRAAAARAYHTPWLMDSERAFLRRKQARKDAKVPVLAILGHGRAGKDEVSQYLCSRTTMEYRGSSSNNLCKFIAHMVGDTEENVFATRHQNRMFWLQAGHAVREGDLTLLSRIMLGQGDLVVGLRGRLELEGTMREGLVDCSVWIDNPRVQPDPTVEFTAADCDLVIVNHGSLMDLYRRLDRFLNLLHRGAFNNLR